MAFLFGVSFIDTILNAVKDLTHTGRMQPQTHISGDTLIFTEELSDYPASAGWSAKWYLLGGNTKSFDGVADGSGFKWTIPAADTALWPAGRYKTFIRVTKVSEVHTLNESLILIKANVATVGNGFDARTDLRIIYESIVEAVKKLSSKEVQTIGIISPGGAQRTVTYKDLPELVSMMHRLKRDVDNEERALGIASGQRSGKIVVSMDAAR